MREALAPIPRPIAALALASCVGRTVPVTTVSERDPDSIAYGTPSPVERWF